MSREELPKIVPRRLPGTGVSAADTLTGREERAVIAKACAACECLRAQIVELKAQLANMRVNAVSNPAANDKANRRREYMRELMRKRRAK